MGWKERYARRTLKLLITLAIIGVSCVGLYLAKTQSAKVLEAEKSIAENCEWWNLEQAANNITAPSNATAIEAMINMYEPDDRAAFNPVPNNCGTEATDECRGNALECVCGFFSFVDLTRHYAQGRARHRCEFSSGDAHRGAHLGVFTPE